MGKEYKHLLLDADGTFYDFAATEKSAISKLFLLHRIPPTESNIKAYKEANDICWGLYEKGEISMGTLKVKRFSDFTAKANIDANPNILSEDYVSCLSETGYMLDGAKETLERLSTKYDLSIITNGIARAQRGRIAMSGTESLYSHIFISEEIGYRKPDVRFFEEVLKALGAKKEECLVIGDSATSDISGAVASGIDSILLRLDGKVIDGGQTYYAASYDELLSILDKA